ncbi:MAG: hypothetical protein WC503_00795 [Candidatus Shapirobacteria bacterium]
MDIFNPFPSLDKNIEEIKKLREAYDLLVSIHLEIGSYGQGKLSQELLFKMNDFFEFDDSE